uniref:ribonuclease H n=1 Tax=Catharus ustulatus TaxID=91951 RepID=A0A8C3UYN0_CATUS
MEVDGEPLEFRVDTGASHSAVNTKLGPLSDSTIQVVGVTGQVEERTFLRPLDIKFGGKEFDHQFLYMPNSPESLFGRDLLSMLQAKIIFEKGRVRLEFPEENIAKLFVIKEVEAAEIPQEIEQAVVPWVWETGVPGKSKAAQPAVIELKEGASPVRVRQYPLKLEARIGIAPMIEQFLSLGILQECESEFNTPIFPVRKPNGKYRLVQDLRAINNITKDIHPVVANPYTLLTAVSEKFKWFTVIDLKDAFFCIPLALESRKYFAFEWESPDTGRKKQLTWTRLPQGFKNSPTIFGNQLARELEEWKTTQVKEPPFLFALLQYVDDIFIASTEKDVCLRLTIGLLNMLGQAGYRVSKEKAQLVRTQVIYLGCEISQGVRKLGVNRIQAIWGHW